MNGSAIIQGRKIGQAEVGLVRHLLVEHSDWNRTRLSRELCRRWDWRKVGQTTGRTRNDIANRGPLFSIKDMYLYPLARDFRRDLCEAPASESLRETTGLR